MFIMSKRNLIIPCGAEKFSAPAGYVGNIPDCFAETPYFKALVADGKIVITADISDKSLQAAEEKPVADIREQVAEKAEEEPKETVIETAEPKEVIIKAAKGKKFKK